MVFDDNEQLRSDQEERRREKFSRERGSDFTDRGPRPRSFGGVDRRDYNGIGKKRPIRDDEYGSTSKRSRFDGAVDSYEPQFLRKETSELTGPGGTPVPQLLTFKKFLATQDESLTDEEAIVKYTEYKREFMKQECERFFQAHKDEEWFRLKYHPDPEPEDSGKHRRGEQRQKRLEIFNELHSNGRFIGLNIDYENAEKLIRLMNEVVIRLEDGVNADIEMANEEPIEDHSILDLLTPEELKQREAVKMDTSNVNESNVKNHGQNGSVGNNPGTEEESDMITEEKASTNKHVPLHKTQSIYFRSIPVAVPVADLENICKQHPGFLRLAITDPVIDPKGQRIRTAWATYRWDVNINDIYWAMRNAKINGAELGVSVNRELKRRVRTIGATNGISGHLPIMQNDIRNAAKLVVLLDMRAGFYKEEAEEGEEQAQGGQDQDQDTLANLEAAILRSRNPLLANIKNYLVEETSAEEEALMEKAATINDTIVTQEYETDEMLANTLDLLNLYLRLVHSIDFYASIEYSLEDDMPHRVGIIHVRGRPPSSDICRCTDAGVPLLPKRIVDRHITTINARLQSGLLKKILLSESDLAKLGKKDAEKAVEDFINTNTQQLGPDKWLCPLSGKKFKGAEFVHKHLHSKYAKEIENARYEALYFDNYLADPNRPHNPIFGLKQSASSAEHMSGGADREQRSASPPPSGGGANRTYRSSTHQHQAGGMDDSVGGRQVAEANERIPYRDRFSGDGGAGFGGGNRFGGGRGGGFGGRGSGGFNRNRAPFYEPMNEMNMTSTPMGGGGGGSGRRGDPRAPPSYRDLDAPTEDIF